MRPVLRSLASRAFALPFAGLAFTPFLRGRAAVFMLHRFRLDGAGHNGHDPEALRRVLGHLRRERYDLVDLDDLIARLSGEGRLAGPSVAFTIDDGYADQAEVGAPVFREFDCPVTTFVTSGFLDGKLWFWWDRIDYVFRNTRRRSIWLPAADGAEARLETPAQRATAQAAFTAWCTSVPDAHKHDQIESLAARAEVDVPAATPDAYRPMTWSQLRRCEEGGMRFGAHTETHPILARAGDAQVRQEIEGSWARLQAESRNPSAVFCYPNGQPGDYGSREIDLLRSTGLKAAVIGSPGYVSSKALRASERAAFELLRFGYVPDPGAMIQCASGFERVKSLLRGED